MKVDDGVCCNLNMCEAKEDLGFMAKLDYMSRHCLKNQTPQMKAMAPAPKP